MININKKSLLTMKAIVILVVGLAVLIWALVFLIKFGLGANKIAEDSQCKSSIQSQLLIRGITREALVSEIYCPTKYYTITSRNEEEIKHSLAEALKTCWGTWGQGKLNLFEDESLYCHMCSVIDFKDKKKTISGFTEYLLNTPIKPDSPIKYMSYLTGYTSEEGSEKEMKRLENIKFEGTIDTSKKYAVMFVYARDKGFIKQILDSVSPTAGTIGGGAAAGAVVGVVAGVVIAGTGGAAIVIAGVVAGVGALVGALTADDVDWVSTTMFQEYNAEFLEKTLKCKISPARQDKFQKSLG